MKPLALVVVFAVLGYMVGGLESFAFILLCALVGGFMPMPREQQHEPLEWLDRERGRR